MKGMHPLFSLGLLEICLGLLGQKENVVLKLWLEISLVSLKDSMPTGPEARQLART